MGGRHGILRGMMRAFPDKPLALLAAIAAAGTLCTGAGSTTSRAVLRLVDTSPVTLRGAGFKAHEHVKVTLVARTSAVRRTVATAGGILFVRFAGANPNECTGFSAIAVGNLGSRATYKRAPGMCPQP